MSSIVAAVRAIFRSRFFQLLVAVSIVPVFSGMHVHFDTAMDGTSTTIAVESGRTSRSAMKPDLATPARRVSQTSVIVVAWPTQVNQGETIMGEFRGSNTGTESGGPFSVSGFKIKVTIPTKLTLSDRTSTMGTWTVENQVATLDVGDFAAGAEFSFTMEFEAVGFGDVTLQFDVQQLEFHPGPTQFNCAVQITVTPIVYVDAGAAGPGGVGNPNMPFPTLPGAIDALRPIVANDKGICIVPGSYPGMAVLDFELEMRTWNGEAGASMELDVPGRVTLEDGAVVDVGPGGEVNLGPDGLPDPDNAEFLIDTSLEIISGEFITNGLLDAGNKAEVRIGDGNLRIRGSGAFDFPTEWIPKDPPDGLGRAFDVGVDGIDLLYFGTTDRTVGLEWPPADTSPPTDREDVIRDVIFNPGDPGDDIIIGLRDEDDRLRINGDLIIGGDGRGQSNAGGSNVGSFNIIDADLEIYTAFGSPTVVEIHNGADLTGSTGGLVRFIGGDDTNVWVETDAGRTQFDFPPIEIDRSGLNPGDEPRITFDAEGVLSDAPAGMPANNPDVISTTSFRLTLGNVELLDGLDIFDVGGQYEQVGGEFRMAGISSIGPDPEKNFRQTVRVGSLLDPGNMIIEDGEYYAAGTDEGSPGGDVEIFGDFCLGCTPPSTQNNPQPSDGVFSLDGGILSVVGDFTVGPDTDPSDGPSVDSEKRNRYYLGGECGVLPDKGGLFLHGNYHFDGTGDRFDDVDFLSQEQGLRGNVFFVGATEQTVWHRQDEDAFFCDVIMASIGTNNDGILLLSDAWQNESGTLTLEHGIIDTDDEQFDWIILNPGIEEDLVTRNSSERGMGVVDLGSRDSYINGGVQRVVEKGNTGGGIITGGYLFPVGCQGEESTGNCNDPNGARDVEFFRPLILQLADDLGQSSLARVDYRQDLERQDMVFPQNGLDADATGGGTLTLDVLSNQFWQLEFDRIPSFDPNIRVEADGLQNIFDIKALRLIQWDCDGTNPRLAGLYDLDGEPGGPGDALVNDFIDSVPNLTQEGVNVNECNIIGIASNFLINPIGPAPGVQNPLTLTKSFTDDPVPAGGTVTLEFTIEHIGTPANDATEIGFTDDLDANLFGVVATGLPMNDVCGSGSQVSGTLTLTLSGASLAPGTSCTFSVTVTVPAAASADNYPNITSEIVSMVDSQPVAGGPASDILQVSGPPQADFSITKTADISEVPLNGEIIFTITVTNNGPDAGSARVEDKLPSNVDYVSSLGNCSEFGDTVTCNTGMLSAGQEEVFFITVKATVNGASDNIATVSAVLPAVDPDTGNNTSGPVAIKTDVTDASGDLPTEFALLPNYPNPFNPTTTIQFEVPSTSSVRIALFDLMGREIAVLVDEVKPAGKYEIILDTARLTSGTYLYRMSSGSFTQSRSFVLLK